MAMLDLELLRSFVSVVDAGGLLAVKAVLEGRVSICEVAV